MPNGLVIALKFGVHSVKVSTMLQKYTLRNQIPLFVVSTSAAPVVSIQIWVCRGSAHEPSGLSGISHYIEHALFKGTKNRAVGQIALEIEGHGGEINAFTSFDETVYYATLASRFFERGMDILADAVTFPTFDPEEMEKEREVILEEIKRANDSPAKIVSMNLWSEAFPQSAYGRPIFGFEKTVKKITVATLKRYYERNYHSGTISLFVVGDVEPNHVLTIAQKVFSKVRSGKGEFSKKPKAPSLGQQRVLHTAINSREITETHTMAGWSCPAITHPKIAALDLLCSALGQGESSRIYQRLVKEKKLALDVSIGLVATRSCGLGTLALTCAPEYHHRCLQDVQEVLEQVRQDGLMEEEIERVKSSLESDIIFGKETVEGYARRLGNYYLYFGDPEYEKKYLENVLAVSPTEVHSIAEELFSKRPVLSIVTPSGYPLKAKDFAGLFKPGPFRKSRGVLPKNQLPVREKKGSLVFIHRQLDHLPTVACRIIFPGGSREEDKTLLGLGNLFQSVWMSGTRSFSALEMSKILESLGASVSAFCGKHSFGLNVELMTKHWRAVKPILNEIILTPTFPGDEFSTERELVIREILAERDHPANLCQLNFMEALYPNHPYGRSPLGTRETISQMTPSHIRKYYEDYVRKGRVIVSTVGSTNVENWSNDMARVLGELPQAQSNIKAPMLVPNPRDVRIVCATKNEIFQSHLLVGFLGPQLGDNDRYALKLLASSLSGQGGRLFLELRDKQSLAYQVAPLNNDSPEGGYFGFYIGCSPEKLERALNGIRREIEHVLSIPIDEKALDRAKQYWVGRFELDMQRYAAQALLFGLDEFYGLGYLHSLELPDIIRALSAEQIRTAAQQYLKLDQAVISIVHPTPLEERKVRQAWGQNSSRSTVREARV